MCIRDRYNDEYTTIDNNLTDCNVGSRKKRNIRDNLFILNGIINSAIQNESKPVELQIMDLEKCFDSLSLEYTINDLFDVNLNNDKLELLYKENESAKVKVKTFYGDTNEFELKNVVMQGTIFAGLKCTTQLGKLGKKHIMKANHCLCIKILYVCLHWRWWMILL